MAEQNSSDLASKTPIISCPDAPASDSKESLPEGDLQKVKPTPPVGSGKLVMRRTAKDIKGEGSN